MKFSFRWVMATLGIAMTYGGLAQILYWVWQPAQFWWYEVAVVCGGYLTAQFTAPLTRRL